MNKKQPYKVKNGNNRRQKQNCVKNDRFAKPVDSEMKDEVRKNDPYWYGQDATLLRQAAAIPFSWATGTVSSLNYELADTDKVPGAKVVAPGIMTFRMIPSIGRCTETTDPANIAAFSIYSYVRHANAGSANYDAPDLMMYLLAMGNVYAAIQWLIRIYGISRLYSTRNRYMPRFILSAMGVNYEDVNLHQADLRYGINMLISKAASFATPSNMTYFNRMSFLFQGLYTEGTSPKDQLYAYVPYGFLQYVGDSDQPSRLEFQQLTYSTVKANQFTVDYMLTFVNSLLEPLMQSEDFNIMSGDILKAYGDGGIWKLALMPEDYVVTPKFDIGVLEQMRNITLRPSVTDIPIVGLGVQQVPTVNGSTYYHLQSVPTITSTGSTTATHVATALMASSRILETTTEDVTPELVIESTRGMVAAEATGSGTSTGLIVYPGSDWCGMCVISSINDDSDTYQIETDTYYGMFLIVSNATIAQETNWIEGLFRARAFQFAPSSGIAVVQPESESSNGKILRIARNESYDNYAIITTQEIKRMHEAALLNLFKVPYIGAAKY